MNSNFEQARALQNLDSLAKLMDAQFRIPGTNIRFGFDALLGFFPGIGDAAGFLVSGYMVAVLVRNGASGFVLARMLLNIALDTLIGSLPVVGDIFDIFFKSNQRNMKLMHEHYVQGRHQGGAWKVVVPVLLFLFALIAVAAWAGYKIALWLYHLIQ